MLVANTLQMRTLPAPLLGPRLPWPLEPSHQKAGLREPGKGGVAVVVEGDVPAVDASPGFGKGS